MIKKPLESLLSYEGSLILCGHIQQYWKGRGYDGISVWVERMRPSKIGEAFVIRSNIGPLGFPPKVAAVQAA